jgi:hypothetical protein
MMQVAVDMLALKDRVVDLSQAAVSRHNASLYRFCQGRAPSMTVSSTHKSQAQAYGPRTPVARFLPAKYLQIPCKSALARGPVVRQLPGSTQAMLLKMYHRRNYK